MMNKFITAIIFSLFCHASLAQSSQGIEVVGKASVSLMPDVFSLTIDIQQRGKSAAKAKSLVDSKSKKVIHTLLNHGVDQTRIQSSQMRIFPIYEKPAISLEQTELKRTFNQKDKVKIIAKNQQNQQQRVRFNVTRTITVSFNSLSIYDQTIDDIVKLGVTRVSPLAMAFTDSEKYYQQALLKAIEKARQKAEKMAQQANVKLGSLISIKESPFHTPTQYRMASAVSESFSSQVTEKSISAQVIAIFAIK